MADFKIPENPTYDNKMRMLETSDPANADLFNGMHGQILENCEHLKKQGDALREEFNGVVAGGALAHPVVITADDTTPPDNHEALWVHG